MWRPVGGRVAGHMATPADHLLASEIARDAGRALLELRREVDAYSQRERRDLGDRRAQVLIAEALARHRPDDPILSEEAPDDPVRLAASRVWIVDPLDGTREYAEGREDWAVHVALVVDGTPVAATVALPAMDRHLSTAGPLALAPRRDDRVRLLVSRSRPPAFTDRLQRALDAELVPMGSAGAKAMAVVLGVGDVYAHAGGQYEWDSAAPVAVAAAAGLHVSRLDGSPLRYNQPDPWLPDLLVCRPDLAERVLAVVNAEVA